LVDLVEPKHLSVILRKVNGARYGWDNTPGVSIAFRNLGYTKNGIKRLFDLNGYFRAGTTCAVIGAPDAGISTFFDVLCQREKGGHVTGDIVVNGLPRDHSFNRMVSYAMKDDVHIPLLTVRETLTFSAKLRAPPADNNDQSIKLRVDLNIKLLGLRGCANTIIGNGELRGISGGERRRVTVGCEMVAGTPVVVMDLPTNGLDSATAFDIMNSLKQQSLGGRTFICSLAQPSPELLRLFDTLLVLSKGAVIYFGPRREVVKYFAALGFHCPHDKPIPEFLEELSAIPHYYYTKPVAGAPIKESPSFEDIKEGEVRSEGSIPPRTAPAATPKASSLADPSITIQDAWQILVDGYKHSVTYDNVRREVAREFEPKSDKVVAAARANNYEHNTNLLQQAGLCVKRQFTELFRNRAGIQALISAQIIIALMLGSLFWQLGNSQDDARTRFGLIFFALTFASSVASQLIPPFILLRPVFYLQEHGGYYRSAAYWMGRYYLALSCLCVGVIYVNMLVCLLC
jgi:ABC-type multidrug transport system ATPase subunit